jgi:hypothetical protein
VLEELDLIERVRILMHDDADNSQPIPDRPVSGSWAIGTPW